MFTVFHFKSLNIQTFLANILSFFLKNLLLKHPLISRVIKGDVKTCHNLYSRHDLYSRANLYSRKRFSLYFPPLYFLGYTLLHEINEP